MVNFPKYMPVNFRSARSLVVGGLFLTFALTGWTQSLVPSGGEFSILGRVKGDQVNPVLAFGPTNGIVLWEDNGLDGKNNGAGIGGVTISKSSLQAGSQKIHVSRIVAGDQIKPQVQALLNGTNIFVWESSVAGTPDIYARLAKGGTNFTTADIRVNTVIKDQQVSPVVTGLLDGSAVIAWSSYQQDGSLMGIYARRLLATGAAADKKEFLVNQFTDKNQRNPAITTLAGGNYVIVWISEMETAWNSVDVFARIFAPSGAAVTDEIQINSGTNICASPAVAPLVGGGFTVLWSEKDTVIQTNSWDIIGRAFTADGLPAGASFKVNNFTYGDQYRPKIASGPTGCLAVWTSLGQDGSREGVFGRFLPGGSVGAGAEFKVNTTTISQQIQPAVAWNGVDRFLVIWSSFVVDYGFDLFGQAYSLSSP